jgi:hypothetical protein
MTLETCQRARGGWDLAFIQRDRDCADALGTLGPDRSEQGQQAPRVFIGGSLGDSAASLTCAYQVRGIAKAGTAGLTNG